jgi:methylenetetrahydrofolate dehydrogenase (NADP+) / methenyltetrahydrofolate cyclohydrolase
MIVDGKAIAQMIYKEIANEVTHMGTKPHLTVFTCEPSFETQRYLALKRRKATEVGIGVSVIEFPGDITTTEVITSITRMCMQTDGIIVQLPFPPHIDIEAVLASIPLSLDVDAVHYNGEDNTILPPVVGAIAEIARVHDVLFALQKVVIVGKGRLVGVPALAWCKTQGALVTVVDRDTPNTTELTQSTHILITGAGVPGLITPDMVSPQVVIFDAGTSEDGGVLKGDVSPLCSEKSALFTPVPGGIGPITVAILLRNLIALSKA